MLMEELKRLKTLVNQLVARLNTEREVNAKLQNQLALREAELVRTQTQLKDMKRKVDNLFAQFQNSGDSLL
ncbi:hypothetical protein H6A60_01820 [Sutterella massiliensis]|uniref:DUF904 domain-containing protein n=1 Tax=Sutterella massiliensis TaxID=1816689 RepID=A0ABS2DPJ5_9BURK|nr:hypothetical protein [Sutterella massiliensis]MBM6703245.1 hypothetical protein [Sutterella massiliensis]